MGGNYIKVDRKILKWEWWSDINTFRLFMYMLLSAWWKNGSYKGVEIPRGSFPSSNSELSKETGLTDNEIRTALKHLKSTGEITSKSNNKFTVFTINNYDLYQPINEQDYSQTTGNDTGKEQTINKPLTSHNIKECNNINNSKNNINRVSNDTLCQTESVRLIVEEWNTLSEYGIKPVSRLTSGTKRYDSLIARMRKYSIDDVMKAIDNIRHSDFLQGKHSGKPWQITFDWFVLPNNFPKVLEGNYENVQSHESKQPTRQGYGNSRQEQFNRLMESIQRGEQDEC